MLSGPWCCCPWEHCVRSGRGRAEPPAPSPSAHFPHTRLWAMESRVRRGLGAQTLLLRAGLLLGECGAGGLGTAGGGWGRRGRGGGGGRCGAGIGSWSPPQGVASAGRAEMAQQLQSAEQGPLGGRWQGGSRASGRGGARRSLRGRRGARRASRACHQGQPSCGTVCRRQGGRGRRARVPPCFVLWPSWAVFRCLRPLTVRGSPWEESVGVYQALACWPGPCHCPQNFLRWKVTEPGSQSCWLELSGPATHGPQRSATMCAARAPARWLCLLSRSFLAW